MEINELKQNFEKQLNEQQIENEKQLNNQKNEHQEHIQVNSFFFVEISILNLYFFFI
jgi:hypothetical protein